MLNAVLLVDESGLIQIITLLQLNGILAGFEFRGVDVKFTCWNILLAEYLATIYVEN